MKTRLVPKKKPKPDQTTVVLNAVAAALFRLADIEKTITVLPPKAIFPESRVKKSVIVAAPKAMEFTVVSRTDDGRIANLKIESNEDRQPSTEKGA
ncbi:MAG: hypothetical protein K9L59_10110 [Desulfobacterales bacterium]|nr:hypothetical protein [Desulfobacterales bacterium]